MGRHSGRGMWTKHRRGYLANSLLFHVLFECALTMHNGLISVRPLRHRLHHENAHLICIRMDAAGRLRHWENLQTNMQGLPSDVVSVSNNVAGNDTGSQFYTIALVCRHTMRKYVSFDRMVFVHGCPQLPFSKKKRPKKRNRKLNVVSDFLKRCPPQTNPTIETFARFQAGFLSSEDFHRIVSVSSICIDLNGFA